MRTIFLLLLLTACGRDEGQKQASPNETYPQAVPTADTKAQEEPKEDAGSWYALTEADMPPCSKDTIGRLVFVQATNVFKACMASGYAEVSIKGKDAVQLAKNEWVDPITGKKWLLGGSDRQAAALASCAAPYRAPSQVELVTACQHGIFQVYQGQLGPLPQPTVWDWLGGEVVVASTCAVTGQSMGTNATIVCIQQ